MKFELSRWAMWGRFVAAPLMATLGLSACGGKVERVSEYQPTRIVAVGDEFGLVQATPTGSKYTVNGGNCWNNPLWVQTLTVHYGMDFPQCPGGRATSAVMQASLGAKVADVSAQIAAVGVSFTSKDLFAVMVGANDVREIFNNSTLSDGDKLVAARSRGESLALSMKALVDVGPRVIVVTVPDIGKSPYGRGTGRSGFVTDLVLEFNKGLRIKLDELGITGQQLGIVLSDSTVQDAVANPGKYGFNNVVDAVCTVATPNCTTSTVISGVDPKRYLWADDMYMGSVLQERIGTLAVNLAKNNPF